MSISAKDVNELRQMTGAGMMDCKKALTEAGGDFDKAIEVLRKKGQKVSAARADRATSEGAIFVKTNDERTQAILIALNCETDFVAKNEEFQILGNKIIDAAFESRPSSIEELEALKIGSLTISELISDMVGKIGEKVEVTAYERMEGEAVIPYIHAGSKLGVLVALKGVNGSEVTEVGKDVAMQIAAMNPVAIDHDDVDQQTKDDELRIGKEQAIAEGKPENILDKIAEGKLNKFLKESTLLNQNFVKDNSLTVGKYLSSISKGLTVEKFRRVVIGG